MRHPKAPTKFPLLRPLVSLPVYCLLLLLTSPPAFAAFPILDIPDTPWRFVPATGTFVSVLLFNIYILAGIILFLLIFFAGFMIISGGTSGDSKKSQQGREAATWAVIGFVVIFASYWILQIIKVITGIDIIHPNI